LLHVTAATALVVAACDNPNPGSPVGTFAVTTAVASDTCGGTVVQMEPGNFDVTISNDQGVVYWFPTNGAASASGSLSASRSVSITEVVADDVDQTPTGGGACTLQRSDTLSFTLGPGAAPTSFTGAYTFTVGAASGANCADQLSVHGGGYDALPCTVSFALRGTRQ
jgi:hypothetical protein